MQPYRAYLAVRTLDRMLATDVRRAWREHRNVRGAARDLGMPKSTFHDVARELGLKTSRRRRRACTQR